MTKRYAERVREAGSKREITEAARDLARDVLEATGNEVTDENVSKVMDAAALVNSGMQPNQAIAAVGMTPGKNNPAVNDALRMLGGLQGELFTRGDDEWNRQIQYGEGMDKVKFAIHDRDSIKGYIERAEGRLKVLSPIKELSTNLDLQKYYDQGARSLMAALKLWASDFTTIWGGKVHRDDIGDILLTEKAWSKGISYIKTQQEAVALAAVPDVLAKGIEVDYHTEHKGRATVVESRTFAAPIEFMHADGTKTKVYMGVTVQKTQGDNRYKAHRVLMPDGNEVTIGINITGAVPQQRSPVNGTQAVDTSPVKYSLTDLEEDVKKNNQAQMKEADDLGITNSDGEQLTQALEGGSVVKYSLSSWEQSDREKIRNKLISAGFSGKDVDKWIDDVNGIAAIIAADRGRLDYKASEVQTFLKDNAEYVKTLDSSTLCAKRRLYQGTFDAIQHALPNTVITSDMLIQLRNMMAERNYETPCGICYVESRRRNLGVFTDRFLKNYEGDSTGYKPTMDDLTTTDGLEALRVEHPEAYEAYRAAMAKTGSNNPKVVQPRTEYRNEIMQLPPGQVAKILEIGGLRVQSFSENAEVYLHLSKQKSLDN